MTDLFPVQCSLDTSASMNQRTCLGTTYLDIAKGAVETFMKIRSRDQYARADRYMLVTLDEPPYCIKAGWRESPATFIEELKLLQASSLSGLGPALKESFNLLNLHRLQSGIDNYGMGRNPSYLEPAIIVTITDNGTLSNTAGIFAELNLPMHNQLSGSELTKEPFRWDQRMFGLILRIPGTAAGLNEKIAPMSFNADDAPITAMCNVTGGRSYVVTSHKTLMQSLESIVQKMQPGVVINFEKFGPDPEPLSRDGAKTPGSITPKRDDVIPSPDNIENDQENKPLLNQPVINGLVPALDVMGNKNSTFQPIKSEAQDTSSPFIQDNPIRGAEEPANGSGCLPDGQNVESLSSSASLSTAWQETRRMIYIRANPKAAIGHWPIPESFWPDPGAQTMPPRDAQPHVLFACANAEPMVIDNLPFDKYELEPSPLTQFVLERKQPNYCWQTFIQGSGRGGKMGQPFGYLKASTNLQSVNLFVMPYNYPILLPLLDELFKVHKCKPTSKWKESFELYLQTMPNYFAGPLRNALRRMGAPANLVPDHIDGSLSFSVITYLKKVKHQAKIEADRLINMVGKKQSRDALNRSLPQVSQVGEDKQLDYRKILLRKTSFKDPSDGARVATKTSSDISLNLEDRGIPYPQEHIQTQSFKNPFDITREKLIEQLKKMRLNFYHSSSNKSKFEDDDKKHFMAIGQMGNYQDYLKVSAPLREVDPGQARLHAFGNPFKLKQDHQLYAVDEADVNEAMAGPGMSPKKRPGENSWNNSGKKRRKNENPPPSRRPQGPPNVPPPKLVVPEIRNLNAAKPNVATKDAVAVVNEVCYEVNRKEAIDVDEVKERDVEPIIENGISPEKKPHGKSVNKQLKKLQEIHKNKLSKAGKHEIVDLVAGKGSLLNDAKENPSPILSILRTSLGSDDKTRTQKDGDDYVGGGKKRKMKHDNNVIDGKHTRKNIAKPAAAKTVYDSRKCRLKLQQYHNTKLRLAAWKIVRNTRDRSACFEALKGIVDKINGPREVKCLFTKDLIDEAMKFKLNALVDNLKGLRDTYQTSNNLEASSSTTR
eukprot:gene11193-12367_t